MTLWTAAFALLALLFPVANGAGMAAAQTVAMIELPSGARVWLQERLEDSLGETGLTYRYRYVMPDLAQRVPATTGAASELPDAGTTDGPVDIDTMDMSDEDSSEYYIDDGMIDEEAFDFAPVITIPGTEEAADEVIDRTLSGDDSEALPSAPSSTYRDPVHDDVFWLCQNKVVPDVAKTGKRPTQIVISVADRKSVFGTYDPDVLQLFEAFTLTRDGRGCEWRPW